MDHLHAGNCHFFGFVGERFILRAARKKRETTDYQQGEDDEHEDKEEVALLLGLLVVGRGAVFLIVMRSCFRRGHSLLRFASAITIKRRVTQAAGYPRLFVTMRSAKMGRAQLSPAATPSRATSPILHPAPVCVHGVRE